MKLSISQDLKNHSLDREISQLIPQGLPCLETCAASAVIARRIAENDSPNRHDYLKAVEVYLTTLPKDVDAAVSKVRRDAAKELGVSAMADDQSRIDDARERMELAQQELESAKALEGRRLNRIRTLEDELSKLASRLSAWDIPFDDYATEADNLILAHWDGSTPVSKPFDDLQVIAELRRLKPRADAEIQAKISVAEAELNNLRGVTSKSKAA